MWKFRNNTPKIENPLIRGDFLFDLAFPLHDLLVQERKIHPDTTSLPVWKFDVKSFHKNEKG
jgi:hypothetical protein